jgi:exodeoxyribonuclease VII large subunit
VSEQTYTVGELGAALDAAVREAVGEVWVRGEVAGLKRSARGHLYFDLCEGHEVRARLPVALLAGPARFIERQLAHAGLALADGVELRLRATPEVFAGTGRLQLKMSAVDPAFTVGQLALSRERLLATLAADGTLEVQQRLADPVVPLRIGLLTSHGSAAHHDVVEELTAAGCAFEVVLAHAQVQGEGSAERVVDALRWLYRAHARRPIDVVAIVRGGGSRSDLATFDDAALARAIAKMPMPVWTGIGHEIDTSVADAVAHTAFKTPTAVAAALRARVVEARAATTSRRDRLRAAVGTRLATESERLAVVAQHLERAHAGVLAVEREQVHARRRRLRIGAAAVVAGERARLTERRGRLPRVLARALEGERAHLAMAARQLEALDPARVLARGFSVTRGADGRPLTAAQDAAAGELITTELADGTLISRVEPATPAEGEP